MKPFLEFSPGIILDTEYGVCEKVSSKRKWLKMVWWSFRAFIYNIWVYNVVGFAITRLCAIPKSGKWVSAVSELCVEIVLVHKCRLAYAVFVDCGCNVSAIAKLLYNIAFGQPTCPSGPNRGHSFSNWE